MDVTFNVTAPVPFALTDSLTVRFPPAVTEMFPLLSVVSPSVPLTLPTSSAFASARKTSPALVFAAKTATFVSMATLELPMPELACRRA